MRKQFYRLNFSILFVAGILVLGVSSCGKKDKNKDEGKKGDKGENPNESPEERAKRILKENADLEKGPLTRGRREFMNPEKDW